MSPEDLHFIETLFRSVERQVQEGLAQVRSDMNERFDRVDARLDVQAARLDRIGGLVNEGLAH